MCVRLALLNVCLVALLIPGGPAAAQAPDPTFESDIVKLLTSMGAANLSGQLATSMTAAIMQQLKMPQPAAAAIVKDVVQSQLASHFNGADGMLARMAPAYAKHFTHDDIRALLMFYDSDIGRKTVTVMPLAFQEGARLAQAWATELAPEIRTELEKRLRSEGLIK